MLRRVIAVAGAGLVTVGVWSVHRTTELTNGCQLAVPGGPSSSSGVNSACVQTLARYGEGGLLALAGLVLMVIAWRLIAKEHRLNRASLLSHVPRRLVGPSVHRLSGQAGLHDSPVVPARPSATVSGHHR